MEGNAVNILFLEDDPTIREVLAEYMKLSGYRVAEIARGDAAIALLRENTYDIAVLDVMVPGADGFEVLQHIRDNCPQTATIMLTALDDEKTQIKAFNLFADDYVIKPVSPIILLKRMETILRRTLYMEGKSRLAQDDNVAAAAEPVSGERCLQLQRKNTAGQECTDAKERRGLYLEEEAYSAYYGDEKLPLTLSEYLLLQALYNEPRRVHTREQLILHIYNEEYIGNDRIIDAHVKNLRKKLPINCIKTVIGVGYQYDGSSSTMK